LTTTIISESGQRVPKPPNTSYSSTGELQRVTLPDDTLIEYINDPLGRRIAKKVNGAIEERYLWLDQTTLLAIYDGSGNLRQRFEYADDRVPYVITQGGTTYYLAYDQVGSLRLITDNVGNSIKRVDYDSFGNIISDSNPSFAIPFGFAGGLHDPDTKLVRFGYRDYLPEIGKWTAKDPILFAGGDSNLYGYVQSDPVNWVDPEGLNAAMDVIRLQAPRVMAALEAADGAWGETAPSGKLAIIKEYGPELAEALLQTPQTFGQCIIDSADYLANQALHDLINGAIPASLDAIAAIAKGKATTASSPTRPMPSWTQGPLK
jgi:RHS repeat-associated protein